MQRIAPARKDKHANKRSLNDKFPSFYGYDIIVPISLPLLSGVMNPSLSVKPTRVLLSRVPSDSLF